MTNSGTATARHGECMTEFPWTRTFEFLINFHKPQNVVFFLTIKNCEHYSQSSDLKMWEPRSHGFPLTTHQCYLGESGGKEIKQR